MRCSQRLASIVSLMFVGVLFIAGCKQESPSAPSGEDKSAFQDVTVEVTGMT